MNRVCLIDTSYFLLSHIPTHNDKRRSPAYSRAVVFASPSLSPAIVEARFRYCQALVFLYVCALACAHAIPYNRSKSFQ